MYRQDTNIYLFSRIRTYDPSNRGAADPGLNMATGIGELVTWL